MSSILRTTMTLHLIFSIPLMFAAVSLTTDFNAASCLYGIIISGVNLAALVWAWERIFSKKPIASAVAVIVSKYAILGIILYRLVVLQQVDVLWFLIGTGSMLLTLISLSFFGKRLSPINI